MLRSVNWGVGVLVLAAACGATASSGLNLQQVDDHVYAVVGPFGNRSPENLGNNATFGFVVTEEGVVLIDSGGTRSGAERIHALIRQVTELPVKVVVNTGGQDHRWLGNGYFKDQGARIIASSRAVADQREREQDQFISLGALVGDEGLRGTDAVVADEVFEDSMSFELGGIAFELRRLGPAHTPGDSIVWLPGERIVFAGDIVYVGRILGVMPFSSSRHWIEAFESMAALDPRVVVPGHGPAVDLAAARADTYEYLVFLRETVGGYMDAGGDITGIGGLDQSRFAHLESYDQLKGRNAQQVYQEMEWE